MTYYDTVRPIHCVAQDLVKSELWDVSCYFDESASALERVAIQMTWHPSKMTYSYFKYLRHLAQVHCHDLPNFHFFAIGSPSAAHDPEHRKDMFMNPYVKTFFNDDLQTITIQWKMKPEWMKSSDYVKTLALQNKLLAQRIHLFLRIPCYNITCFTSSSKRFLRRQHNSQGYSVRYPEFVKYRVIGFVSTDRGFYNRDLKNTGQIIPLQCRITRRWQGYRAWTKGKYTIHIKHSFVTDPETLQPVILVFKAEGQTWGEFIHKNRHKPFAIDENNYIIYNDTEHGYGPLYIHCYNTLMKEGHCTINDKFCTNGVQYFLSHE